MDDLDALLADLQNSVPGNQHPLASGGTTRTVTQQHHHVQQEPYFGASTGYGSLKNREGSQSPTYQDIYATIGPPTSQQSNTLNSTNGRTTYNYPQPYQTQGSLQRSGYNNSTYQNQPNHSYNSKNGLSELDSLLQDLSDARYHNVDKKRDVPLPPIPTSGMSTNYNTINSNYSNRTMDGRPAVDSLVDEMDNLNIYAVPNVPNGAGHKSPTPGRHVTITVRETKTEKLAGPQGPVGSIEENIVQQRDTFVPNNASNEMYSSAATKELDDLMASLSDFKVNNGSHHLQQVTDYAKPNQGISHLTKTITETTVVEDTEPPNNAAGDQLESMLGSLQAKMSQTSNSAAQKGRCNACEKPIVGQVISALGKTWHPEHFTCNHCSQELGTRNFFERDGFPYCETDYHNLFSPRCAYCNGAILDKCVTALEKTWHTEHFFCAQCGQQFGEDGFHERDGKPYCRNDYFEMFAPKCNGCNRAIMENYISALNSQWHPDCFVCRDCRQPFHGGSFFDHEGLPYCETHYHAKRGSLCAGCSKPITGRCITAMFRKFHPEHFVCAFCLKQLNKGTFKEQNDKPYCHGCFEKIFG